MSPLYQGLLSEAEKQAAKKWIKEEVDKYEEATENAVQGDVDVPGNVDNDQADEFIGASLFTNFKPRELEKIKKNSTADTKLSADFEVLEKDAKNLFCQTAAAIAAKKPCPPAEDPMDYWIRMLYLGKTQLAAVALDILCIPATSVPSERMFSLCGFLSSGIVQ